ncbi:MAG: CoA-binding protein [Patescibacteria group bacterium]|nr:CoA-binding protein [Patescibacteria group bacterium]
MTRDLTGLFFPKSVCVIGASRNQGKVGAIVLKNIIDSGFKGKIYPVNPNTSELDDLNCYKDVASLPEIPDLAVIAIPATQVLEVLKEIGEKGIKNAVVFSAGFKETGEEGERLEKELINIAESKNINVLGPNCLGFVNNLVPINVTFGEVAGQSGNLRFISQSGAIASSLFDWCKTNKLGFSEFITLGNKAVINENDILGYFQKHARKASPCEANLPGTLPIGLYLESISKGSQFLKLTSEIAKQDPIFILKPGKTEAASKAMQSHTGAIAVEDAVLDAALFQAGVIRCQTLEDFFDLSRSFSWNQSPKGDKVAIISNAGGPAVISADAVISEGLKLAEFDTETHEKLLEILPRYAGILNPVDVLGDALADRYANASEIILQNKEVDALVVILTPQIMTQIEQTADSLGRLSEKYQKPIFCSFIGGSLVLEGEQELNKLKIPSFRFPERAIWATGKMWQFRKLHLEEP